jgi:hypothetical protein
MSSEHLLRVIIGLDITLVVKTIQVIYTQLFFHPHLKLLLRYESYLIVVMIYPILYVEILERVYYVGHAKWDTQHSTTPKKGSADRTLCHAILV